MLGRRSPCPVVAPWALAVALGAFPVACSSQATAPSGSASNDAGQAPGTFGEGGVLREGGVCRNLQCAQVDCSSKGKPADATTLSGIVYDPAGQHPLYDVIVYVPNGPVEPFTSGVTCDRCGVLTTGSPVVSTLTDASGKFELRNVPVGNDVPLVMQVGKWRRQVKIPSVQACADNPQSDPNLTRLPRSQSEGDLPQMALMTGGCDAFECLLRKIGVADAEFTSDQGSGRVHVFQGLNGMGMYQSSPSTALWSDVARMKRYDVVVNSCECAEHGEEKPAALLQNHLDYANAGGRVFDTHYNYYWILNGPAPLPATATFAPGQSGPDGTTAVIDTSFPKGSAFATWLVATGTSTTLGQIPVTQAKYDVTAVSAPSTRWIYGTNGAGGPDVFHYTFNTPVGAADAQQCGKVVFSDFHAAAGATISNPFPPFPGECNTNPMTAQEAALEFMLFDLSSCVQNDTQPPPPPPTQ